VLNIGLGVVDYDSEKHMKQSAGQDSKMGLCFQVFFLVKRVCFWNMYFTLSHFGDT